MSVRISLPLSQQIAAVRREAEHAEAFAEASRHVALGREAAAHRDALKAALATLTGMSLRRRGAVRIADDRPIREVAR